MADLSKRPYRPTDAAAVAGLLNFIDVQAGGHPSLTVDETQTTVSELVVDPELDTVLVFAGDELVAVAVTTAPPADGNQAELFGGVHPQWRGQGLGRELLAGQLERAAANHARRDPGRDWVALTGSVAGAEETLRLFRRFGLTPARYWFDMVADTAAPVCLDTPEGIAVVPYATDHDLTLFATHTEAFRDHWGHQDWTAELWMSLTIHGASFQPNLSRLAFDGDELVAYVLSYSAPEPEKLYVGHVGTRRSWRRRGIATAMLGEVVAAAGEAGYTAAGLGVDADSPTGAVGVYERVGFAVTAKSVTYSTPLPAR